jgi:hypothetical protein
MEMRVDKRGHYVPARDGNDLDFALRAGLRRRFHRGHIDDAVPLHPDRALDGRIPLFAGRIPDPRVIHNQ